MRDVPSPNLGAGINMQVFFLLHPTQMPGAPESLCLCEAFSSQPHILRERMAPPATLPHSTPPPTLVGTQGRALADRVLGRMFSIPIRASSQREIPITALVYAFTLVCIYSSAGNQSTNI